MLWVFFGGRNVLALLDGRWVLLYSWVHSCTLNLRIINACYNVLTRLYLSLHVNTIKVYVFNLLYLNATLFFWSRQLCKISCLVTTDYIFLFCFIRVYILSISACVSCFLHVCWYPFHQYPSVIDCVLNGTLNDVGFILLIETK